MLHGRPGFEKEEERHHREACKGEKAIFGRGAEGDEAEDEDQGDEEHRRKGMTTAELLGHRESQGLYGACGAKASGEAVVEKVVLRVDDDAIGIEKPGQNAIIPTEEEMARVESADGHQGAQDGRGGEGGVEEAGFEQGFGEELEEEYAQERNGKGDGRRGAKRHGREGRGMGIAGGFVTGI